MRITAVTICRDHGPFLLEWIAFHRMIGVTGFVVYWRESDDGTADLLAALAGEGWLLPLPAPDDPLRDARARPETREADFSIALQPHEFLNITAGDGRIAALLSACGGPDMISVSAQVFGWCGVKDYADSSVIGTFRFTHNPDICGDRLALPVRTLFRSALPLLATAPARPYLRVKRLNRGDIEVPRWTDGSGREVPRGFALASPDKPVEVLPAAGARAFATLNCYPLKSLETFLATTARVEGGAIAPGLDDSLWRESSDDGWTETSIQRHLPALADAIATLKAMPGVAKAHDRAVDLHRRRIAAMRRAAGYDDLAARLAALPTRPPAELAVMKLLGVA